MSSHAKRDAIARTKRTLNSHYLAKLIIKNWAHADNKVAFVDLAKDTDSTPPHRIHPRNFGLSGATFPDEVEKALGAEIESPLGDYIARCKTKGAGALIDTSNDAERRAIILALITQGSRTHAGLGGVADVADLVDFVGRGPAYMSTVAMAVSQTMAVVGVNCDGPLCLNSTGLFPIPMFGGAGWGIALTPETFVAVVPKEAERDVFVFWRDVFPAFSIGIKGDRIVLPPNKHTTASKLREVREHAIELVSNVLRVHHLMTDVVGPIARSMNGK